jgi:hypothetical protein
MDRGTHRDPAERSVVMRLLYRDWRPTIIGRSIGRLMMWWTALGLPSENVAVLEVRDHTSGERRRVPMVIAQHNGQRYVVSMLGPGSNWVKSVEAAQGEAVIRKGGEQKVRLVAVPATERAPILRAYVKIATSGRKHFPVAVDAPLSDFAVIAARYPVFRIDPILAETGSTI